MSKLQTKGLLTDKGPRVLLLLGDKEFYMTCTNAEQFAMQILKVVATLTSQWELIKRRKNGNP